jgi:hypothetical protein
MASSIETSMRALAGLAALDQRGQDVAVGIHAGRDVGDGTAGLGRLVLVPVIDRKPDSLWISRS